MAFYIALYPFLKRYARGNSWAHTLKLDNPLLASQCPDKLMKK